MGGSAIKTVKTQLPFGNYSHRVQCQAAPENH